MGEIVVLENLGLLLLKISKYKKIAFSYVPHTLPLGLSQQDPAGWVAWRAGEEGKSAMWENDVVLQ